MKHLFLYTTLIVSLLLAACNKIELEEPEDGTPVFSAELNIENGPPLTWEAGIDSFYMFTEYDKDELGVYSFRGKMEKENCTDCGETLTISIRNAEQLVQGTLDIDQALSLDRYSYYDPNDVDSVFVLDTVMVSAEYDLIADTTAFGFSPLVNYEWLLGTDLVGTLSVANISFDILNIPNLELTLRASNFANGDSCVSWQTQTLRLNPQERCAVYIKPNYNVDNFLESLEAVAIPPDSTLEYEWSAGQFDQEFNPGPFEPFVDVTVTVSGFSNGCIATAGFVPEVNTGEPPSICIANFEYDGKLQFDTIEIPGPGVQDSLQLSTVTIIYKDRSGNVYRSDRQTQDNAQFEISNVEDYDDNEKGEPTKKMDLQFSCVLWDDNGNTITITDGKAVWGIAYPK